MSNPIYGHAISLMVYEIINSLDKSGKYPKAEIWRSNPVTTIADNYDILLFPKDAQCRSPRYNRYLNDEKMLRTMTSGLMPRLIQIYNKDTLLVHPGICYRRDVKDKRHVGEPHQTDIWQISSTPKTTTDLEQLVSDTVGSILPYEYRLIPTTHPYTVNGNEIEMLVNGDWIEIGECGIIHPSLLKENQYGLAIGLGLDRWVMIAKGIDDIRLLRSDIPAIASQMKDLSRYQNVAKTSVITRDISIAVLDTDILEDITEIILNRIGELSYLISEISLLSETPYQKLPQQAINRMDMKPNQKNVLLRLEIQSPLRNITKAEANQLRDLALNAKK